MSFATLAQLFNMMCENVLLHSFVDFLMVVLIVCHSCRLDYLNFSLGFIDCDIVKIPVLKVAIDRNFINFQAAHIQKNHFYDQSLIAYKV